MLSTKLHMSFCRKTEGIVRVGSNVEKQMRDGVGW